LIDLKTRGLVGGRSHPPEGVPLLPILLAAVASAVVVAVLEVGVAL